MNRAIAAKQRLDMDSVPEKGTAEGQFFHREEDLFHEQDPLKPPTTYKADEELETNVPPRLSLLMTGYTVQSSEAGCHPAAV
jgi:hypothetical protein